MIHIYTQAQHIQFNLLMALITKATFIKRHFISVLAQQQTGQYCHQKYALVNKYVFKRFLKMSKDLASLR